MNKTTGTHGNRDTLIVGCGYLGKMLAQALPDSNQIIGLVRSASSATALRQQGITPLRANLDQALALPLNTRNLDIYYLAPPPKQGQTDPRMQHFLAALAGSGQPRKLVYVSTTGVYGDCLGGWVDETTTPAPKVDRALRRFDAERQLRAWHQSSGAELVILRVAGIYGPGKLPLERLRAGIPMIAEQHAPWTNRIHAHDLVQVCLAAMQRGKDGEIYNVSDGQPGNMADYFKRVADRAGLPRPPVIDPEQGQQQLSPGMQSYLAESRRIDNRKMLRDLQIKLRYPSLNEGLEACGL